MNLISPKEVSSPSLSATTYLTSRDLASSLQSSLLEAMKQFAESTTTTRNQVLSSTPARDLTGLPSGFLTDPSEIVRSDQVGRYLTGLPSEIIPGRVYLGGVLSTHPAVLSGLGITHVVNCSRELGNQSQVQTLNLNWVDSEEQPIASGLTQAFKFMYQALCGYRKTKTDSIPRPNVVLVHCYAGISRSATVLIYFLMRVYRTSVFQAWRHVLERRPIIQPNPGFVNSLRTLFYENLEVFYESTQSAEHLVGFPEWESGQDEREGSGALAPTLDQGQRTGYVRWGPLMDHALETENLKLTRSLVENPDLEIDLSRDVASKQRRSYLERAILTGRPELVQTLVEGGGASVNQKCLDGKTVLMLALLSQKTEPKDLGQEEDLSLSSGPIGPEIFKKRGYLEIETRQGQNLSLIARYLLESGADHTLRTPENETALTYAIQKADFATAKKIFELNHLSHLREGDEGFFLGSVRDQDSVVMIP